MNVQERIPFFAAADDFLRWNEGREGRREFVHGRVAEMMVGVSRGHAKLALRLSVALLPIADANGFTIASADFGVRTVHGIRYPDVVVDGVTGFDRDLAADAPILIAEILSPSSLALDFGEKAAEYTAIPSLLHYLVLSQDEPRVWLWSRGGDGFGSPEMIAGADETFALPGLGMTLALAELYRGVA